MADTHAIDEHALLRRPTLAARNTEMPKIEYIPPADPPPWNAGRKVGSKRALKQRQVWAVRFFLDDVTTVFSSIWS